jgi:hypothetical protein
VGVASAAAITTTGSNVTTGKGSWFIRAGSVNGSIILPGATAEHPGILTMRTGVGGAAGSQMTIARWQGATAANNGFLPTAKLEQKIWILSLTQLTLTRNWFGLSDSPGSSVPANALLFKQDLVLLGNGNWWCVNRASSVDSTPVDTGIPVISGQFYRLAIKQAVAGTITYEIDGVQVASISTQVPTANLNAGGFGSTNANSGVQQDVAIDYAGLASKTLTR